MGKQKKGNIDVLSFKQCWTKHRCSTFHNGVRKVNQVHTHVNKSPITRKCNLCFLFTLFLRYNMICQGIHNLKGVFHNFHSNSLLTVINILACISTTLKFTYLPYNIFYYIPFVGGVNFYRNRYVSVLYILKRILEGKRQNVVLLAVCDSFHRTRHTMSIPKLLISKTSWGINPKVNADISVYLKWSARN